MASPAAVEIDAQYRQLREECGLMERSGRGKLVLEGADAAEYLQSQVTNDVEALAPGEGHYAALLDRKGHIQADMRVLRLAPERIWVETEDEAYETTRRHLETYKIGRRVEVEDATDEWAVLSRIGPASVAFAAAPSPALHATVSANVCGVE